MAFLDVKQNGKSTKLLSSVARTLSVLDLLATEPHGLGLAEISRRMGLHKSTVYRMLLTLEASGLLERNPRDSRYRLGLKVLQLASQVLGRYGMREIAGPYMEQLSRETGEVIHLAVLDGAEIVYLDKRGQGQVLTVATRIGGRNPAYASAMGKILLASLPWEQLEGFLARTQLKSLTPNTICDPAALRRALDRIRRQGHAVDNEEAFPGIRCVAAPVRDANGEVVAALSATVPSQRMGRTRVAELRRLVVETAAMISRRMLECETEGVG
jgi:IclR family KDG regulon transcriptional repressor